MITTMHSDQNASPPCFATRKAASLDRELATARSAKPIFPTSRRCSCVVPKRNREFWLRALGQLSRRQPPWGLPKYGCVLESDEQAERKLAIDVGAEMVPAIGGRTEIVSAGKRSIETAAYHPPQNVRQNKSIRKNQLSQMPLLTSTAAAPKAWQR
jgi:hypothetical protein